MDQRIIYNTDGGMAVVIPAKEYLLEHTIEELVATVIPANALYEIVSASDIPADRTFRNAWEKVGRAVQHNLTKCKAIAHEKRRVARSAEFAPHDEIIMKQIPGKDAAAAETARQAIRAKYDAMQTAIDLATTVEDIKAAAAEVLR